MGRSSIFNIVTTANVMSASSTLLPPPDLQPEQGEFSDIFDRFSPEGDLPELAWITRLELNAPRRNLKCMPRSIRIKKRMVDIVGALVLMVLCAPLMLVSYIIVRIVSPGAVIFTQTRIGLNLRNDGKSTDRRQELNGPPEDTGERRVPDTDRRASESFGKPFTIYKFRSMRLDAEANGAQFAKEGDDRVFPFGKFMRRSRIDELPQLWNILKGDMSLVGPRPERPEFIEGLTAEIPDYLDRLGLKPGLSGISQIVNGYDNNIESFRRKIAYDLLYLQNCCLRNDLKILLKTIKVVITGHGAL